MALDVIGTAVAAGEVDAGMLFEPILTGFMSNVPGVVIITRGTDIPIVSEEESRAMNPDYYLVLPWHFKEEFVEREKETLTRGIGLIFPLPKIEIIKK